MDKKTLHITNGGSLTKYLKKLNISDNCLTWQEMLCEGQTHTKIDSEDFLNQRINFLSNFYNIDISQYTFKNELEKLNNTENYSEIVLWFEYDLFCHINLMAAISLLQERKINLPLYLVCSGHVDDENNLKGLSELNKEQLHQHYENKIQLLETDIDLAVSLWEIYCGKNHNILIPYITKNSSFLYLSNCLKAHLKRFPNSVNGLNTMEEKILTVVRGNNITSKYHLLGIILKNQDYYGYGDSQINRIINYLSIFFNETENSIVLNEKGNEALSGSKNFAIEINNNITFGGVNRLGYYYHKEKNELIKTQANAH